MKKYTNVFINLFFIVISLLTVANLVYFSYVKDMQTFVEHSVTHPYLTLFGIFAFLSWTSVTTLFGLILLFSGRWREKAFLKLAQIKVRDEMELNALNEAIKKTFIGNLVLITLAIGLSSIKINFIETDKKDSYFGKNLVYAVMMPLQENKKNNNNELKELREKALKEKSESDFNVDFEFNEDSKKLEKAVESSFTDRLFSVYGAMWFLVIQFVMFRVILFQKKREFE